MPKLGLRLSARTCSWRMNFSQSWPKFTVACVYACNSGNSHSSERDTHTRTRLHVHAPQLARVVTPLILWPGLRLPLWRTSRCVVLDIVHFSVSTDPFAWDCAWSNTSPMFVSGPAAACDFRQRARSAEGRGRAFLCISVVHIHGPSPQHIPRIG